MDFIYNYKFEFLHIRVVTILFNLVGNIIVGNNLFTFFVVINIEKLRACSHEVDDLISNIFSTHYYCIFLLFIGTKITCFNCVIIWSDKGKAMNYTTFSCMQLVEW